MSFRGSLDDERGGLLAELTEGFEALMQKADDLVTANKRLDEQLQALQHEFRDQDTPNRTSSTSSAADGNHHSHPSAKDWRRDAIIDKGVQAWKLLRIATLPAVPLPVRTKEREVSENPRGQKGPEIQISRTFEEDFTTEGPKGDLKCPFSRQGAIKCGNPHRLPDPNPYAATAHSGAPAASPDPLVREFHSDVKDQESVPDGTGTKCPIRFIDQHTPEEVAKYVEKHKHEIPRSHEVCVKRYQANEASIRSLDAKYGSLVKMIQGLGEKHKPMLPADAEAADEPVLDDKSKEKVENWAKGILEEETPAVEHGLGSQHSSEERTGHFERPLDEVRLGESPSRPWGIQVPYDGVSSHPNVTVPIALEQTSSVARPANAPVHEEDAPRPKGKCPFGHDAPDLKPDPAKAELPSRTIQPDKKVLEEALASANRTGHLVFMGPVFFGYSAEDAAALMGVLPGMGTGSQH